MRKKKLKIVVTFPTTTAAMTMEKACKENEVPGRLIPVPTSITAGCGLAWCADPEDREKIETAIRQLKLEKDRIYECMV